MNEPKKGEIGGGRAVMSHKLHHATAAQMPGYRVKDTNKYGTFRTRLGGWLRTTFGTHLMFYETNSQAPARHLSLYELRALGAQTLRASAKFLYSNDARPLLHDLQQLRRLRYARWNRYGYIDRLFPESDHVFGDEHGAKTMASLEAYIRKRNDKPSWLSPLYEKIRRGELPRKPVWSRER